MTHAIDIHTRTADTATVDGQLVQRGHYATIYDAALAHVVNRAQDLGRPVLVKATDGVKSGHTFWITVATNGTVEPADPPTGEPANTGQAPPAARTGGRRRHSEPDDINENDFYPAPSEAGQSSDASVEAPIVDSTPWVPTIAPPTIAPPTIAPPTETPPPPASMPAAVDVGGAASTPVSESPSFESAAVQDQTFGHSDPDPRTGPIQVPATQPQPHVAPARGPYAQQVPAWQRPPQSQPQRPGQLPMQPPPWTPQPPVQHAPQGPSGPMSAMGAPPSLADLRASRPDAPEAPASTGWRGGFNKATGGLLKLAPSEDELRLRRAGDAVQRSLRGPRTVVVINTKGGGGKTTAVYSLAATFGQARGGYVLGWDNNETRGTLAWRAAPARHTNTAVDLLRDLERFEDPSNARVGDLDNYVRAQGSAQFDVLASDENAASAASIDDAAFRALHRSLSRFYRILVIDTGNNVKAPNWGAAIDLADQLVVVSSVREDTAGGASWTLDHLTEIGHGDKVRNAVTILSAPKAAADPDQRAMHARFREHFAARTRTVLDVPFDPALVDGDSIVFEALSPATRQAWLVAAAAIAEGL